MSGSGVTLRFGVVVADGIEWTPQQRDEAEACEEPECKGDWLEHPIHTLREAMETAGDAWIRAHPEMYRTELV